MRNTNLDLARALAVAAVVFGHTIMLFWDFDPSTLTWAVYNLLWLLVRGFLMLFFMISGTLFLSREKLEFKKHMKRVLHFLILFYVWSFICNGIDVIFLHYWSYDGTFISRVLGGYFHLWFLPTMAMCYCALPLLHGLAYGNQENIWRGTLLLFAIVTVITTLKAIPDKPLLITSALQPYELQSFQYFVIMPMGWQLSKRRCTKKAISILAALSISTCVLFAWLNRQYSVQINMASDAYYKDLSISSGLMGVFIYSLVLRVKRIPSRYSERLKLLSCSSLGIYLIHPILIDILRSRHCDLSQYSALWLFPLCYTCLIMLSLCLTRIILIIPRLKKIVT